jgi:SET domain
MHAHTLHTQVSPTYVWAEEDLSLLEGSPVISATVSMKRKLEAEYATLANGLFARKQQLFPADTYSYAAFQWAFTMLFSRAIRLTSLKSGEAIALIPYADLFNHNPYANSYIDARETGWITKKDEVAVYSDRSYKRMEQVRVMHFILLCSYSAANTTRTVVAGIASISLVAVTKLSVMVA